MLSMLKTFLLTGLALSMADESGCELCDAKLKMPSDAVSLLQTVIDVDAKKPSELKQEKEQFKSDMDDSITVEHDESLRSDRSDVSAILRRLERLEEMSKQVEDQKTQILSLQQQVEDQKTQIAALHEENEDETKTGFSCREGDGGYWRPEYEKKRQCCGKNKYCKRNSKELPSGMPSGYGR